MLFEVWLQIYTKNSQLTSILLDYNNYNLGIRQRDGFNEDKLMLIIHKASTKNYIPL